MIYVCQQLIIINRKDSQIISAILYIFIALFSPFFLSISLSHSHSFSLFLSLSIIVFCSLSITFFRFLYLKLFRHFQDINCLVHSIILVVHDSSKLKQTTNCKWDCVGYHYIYITLIICVLKHLKNRKCSRLV